MSRLCFSRLCAKSTIILLAITFLTAGGELIWAKSVPQLPPLRTIELAPRDTTQEEPVISTIAISPTGKRFATGGDDHLVRIWDVEDATVVGRLAGHADWVRSVAFSPDGHFLASAGNDRRIRFWNISSETPLFSVAVPSHAIHCLAYDPDGKLLASAGFSNVVHVFTTDSGKTKYELARARR